MKSIFKIYDYVVSLLTPEVGLRVLKVCGIGVTHLICLLFLYFRFMIDFLPFVLVSYLFCCYNLLMAYLYSHLKRQTRAKCLLTLIKIRLERDGPERLRVDRGGPGQARARRIPKQKYNPFTQNL